MNTIMDGLDAIVSGEREPDFTALMYDVWDDSAVPNYLQFSPVVRGFLGQAQDFLGAEELRTPEFIELVKGVVSSPNSQRDEHRRNVLLDFYQRELGGVVSMVESDLRLSLSYGTAMGNQDLPVVVLDRLTVWDLSPLGVSEDVEDALCIVAKSIKTASDDELTKHRSLAEALFLLSDAARQLRLAKSGTAECKAFASAKAVLRLMVEVD